MYRQPYSQWGSHLCGATEEKHVKPKSRYEPNCSEDCQSWPQLPTIRTA